ncbi:metallophosphoesterase family protein [Sporosarcina gallistercoris]|uniref:Metallophosphoesterase n=1 Tax=Sporosarcina gallistercoris TaxID=2762245 RepID=A0ABR8PL97_9BACL|nr:DNA repair exonuclease [Sporosarcina gallistercoris]MBD7908951.1 metallophosphoesterase [Sporosarcina gallistercoris]
MIRFLHTADLHLDSPFKGITDMPITRLTELRESTFAAYEKLIHHAEKTTPDFVLIAGDIYDGEDRSLRAQMRFVKGLERLKRAEIPVFISHGNHDHLGGKWTRFQLPDNVTVFGPEVETAELVVHGQRIRIHGFSYKERHIKEAMIGRFPKSNREPGTIDIGMLHGSIAGEETHAVYAPFTTEALLEKGYQYWALGHIHKRQLLHNEPPIVYPGNLQGRHRNEQGVKGFYDVELELNQAALKFVPTSVLVFDEIEVDCKEISLANEWLIACQNTATEVVERNGSSILSVRNVKMSAEATHLFSGSSDDEWLEVLRESADPDVWFSELFVESQQRSSLSPESPLVRSVKEQMENWEEEDWRMVLQDVYQHARSGPYLFPLSSEMKEELRKEAGELISNELST